MKAKALNFKQLRVNNQLVSGITSKLGYLPKKEDFKYTQFINKVVYNKENKYNRIYTEKSFLNLAVYKVTNQVVVNYIRRVNAQKYSASYGAFNETTLTAPESKNSFFDTIKSEMFLYEQNMEKINVKRLVRNAIKANVKNDRDKKILITFFLLGLKQTEISNKFDMPLNTIKSVINRNRNKVKNTLSFIRE